MLDERLDSHEIQDFKWVAFAYCDAACSYLCVHSAEGIVYDSREGSGSVDVVSAADPSCVHGY